MPLKQNTNRHLCVALSVFADLSSLSVEKKGRGIPCGLDRCVSSFRKITDCKQVKPFTPNLGDRCEHDIWASWKKKQYLNVLYIINYSLI